MGHLLKTVNPDAVAEIELQKRIDVPLPKVSDTVIFFPRPGELRAGHGKHAAIVTAVHEEDKTLDLVVVYDADDLIGQRRVPRRNLDGGMGWESKSSSVASPNDLQAKLDLFRSETSLENEGIRAEISALRSIVFGRFQMPEGESIIGIVDEHEDRLISLEKAAKMKSSKAGKAK
jgi:hypothetical protein